MNFLEAFKMAFSNIRSSKMRSFLTMLGIIIGVAAVIVIVGLGNGLEIYMTEQFESIGTNSLSVSVFGRNSGRSVSEEQFYEIVDENPEHFSRISPTVTMQAGVKIGTESLSNTSVTGVGEQYLDIKDYDVMAGGRGLQYVDMEKREKVCLIGSYINKEYYDGMALGETLKIGGNTFKIIGVIDEESDSTEHSTDNMILVPYTTAARLSQMGTINSYTITVRDVNNAAEGKRVLENELLELFGDEDAYMVISMAEMLDIMTDMLNIMITVLTIIAGISLVVGGIGIMNIMLVSVSERTKEIGIRKALGAKERYIMSQFVIEAATTSALGGVLGIIIGEIFSSIATVLVTAILAVPLTVTPSAGSILTAFGISVGIGILFGYLPAKKASLLNPIDALRHE